MNKLFTMFFTLFVLFCFALNAQAYINSESDILLKMKIVKQLESLDLASLVNKNEIIGYNASNYQLACMGYSKSVSLTYDKLNEILKQLRMVRNFSEISDSEKSMQISKLYSDAESALTSLDRDSNAFVQDARRILPTITYDRFQKKFRDYYYSLGL